MANEAMAFDRNAAAAALAANVSRERFLENENNSHKTIVGGSAEKLVNKGVGKLLGSLKFMSVDFSVGLCVNIAIMNVRSLASLFPDTSLGKTLGFQAKSITDSFNVMELNFGEPTPKVGILLTIIIDFIILTAVLAILYVLLLPIISTYENIKYVGDMTGIGAIVKLFFGQ